MSSMNATNSTGGLSSALLGGLVWLVFARLFFVSLSFVVSLVQIALLHAHPFLDGLDAGRSDVMSGSLERFLPT